MLDLTNVCSPVSGKLTGEHHGRKGWGELAMLPAMCADWGR
jgi:hypothetical protein